MIRLIRYPALLAATLALGACPPPGDPPIITYENCEIQVGDVWTAKNLHLDLAPVIGACPVNAAPGQIIQTGAVISDHGAPDPFQPDITGQSLRVELDLSDSSGWIGTLWESFDWELTQSGNWVLRSRPAIQHPRGGSPTTANFDVQFWFELRKAWALATILYYEGDDM